MRQYQFDKDNSHGLPHLVWVYSTNIALLQEMWGAVPSLETPELLRTYAQTSSVPELNHTLVPAIDFFAEYKGRNRRKILDHLGLGYGPRLNLSTRFDELPRRSGKWVSDIYIGLTFYIQKCVDPITRDRRGLTVAGVRDFRELGHDLISLHREYWVKR